MPRLNCINAWARYLIDEIIDTPCLTHFIALKRNVEHNTNTKMQSLIKLLLVYGHNAYYPLCSGYVLLFAYLHAPQTPCWPDPGL